MYNDTITLFNLHNGAWYSHIIKEVDAGITSGAGSTALNGTTRTDSAIILIQTSSSKVINADNSLLPYVSPKAFSALENPESVITFQPQTDFILIGEYENSEPINEDDFETGFYDEMNSKYDNVFLITSAAYFDLIPHFEIGAR